MASKSKSRSGGKSPTQSNLSVSSTGHHRKSAKAKEQRFSTEDEKETLAFKVLSQENTKKLAAIEDVDELQEAIAEILQITNHSIDLKDGSLVDYYVAGFWWGKEQGYSQEQLSAFYTVIHTLLENIKEKQMSVTDNLKEFRKMLAGIGQESAPEVKLPSGGLETIFDVNQAKAVTDYIYTSLFQHYRLFEFAFGHTQAEEIIGTDLELEVPTPSSFPWPPPLDEGVSEDVYQQHIASPPSSPAEQESADAETKEEGQSAPGDSGESATAEAEGREADILSKLTPAEVEAIMNSVFDEMLGGLKNDVAAKLREKENAFINRINKIHKVSEN